MVDSQSLCAICCCISFMTLVLMLISSYNSLEVNEIGLDYSSISKTVDKKAYGAGFHFLGLGHSFIKYPKTVQQFEFSNDSKADYPSLHSRTSDGLEVQLEISFQYRLVPNQIYDLFSTYKDEYRMIFRNMAIDILTDNATEYGAYQFFVDRQEIGTSMQIALNQHFKEHCFAQIEFFQLRSVDLPDKFEGSIQLSEVYKQNINKAEAEKEKVQVELQTQLKTAEFQKQVTLNLAEGDAFENEQKGQAKAKSFLVKQNVNAKSYKALKDSLEMNNNELIDYVKQKVIRDHDDNGLIINLPDSNSKQNT